ncbi:MAG TPA: methylated-DNA--[protein]-cysteine S-methyltransferase [Acidimicrobiia bacterium]|nr:methylated-DNA--[protein]-cysteine S-methyltransferase [Acidimicrobiia bacterium]
MTTDTELGSRLARGARAAARAAGTPDALDVARAERRGLVDIAYVRYDAPIGRLLLAATEHGLVRIAFGDEPDDDVLEHLAATISPRIVASARRLDGARRTFDRYFAGRGDLDALAVDLQLALGFDRTVLDTLRAQVPLGATITYAGLADRAGSPRAARAVGNAMAKNPVPLVVPCHRVVPSAGGVGSYGGGPHIKAQLLALEGAALQLA